MEECAQKGRIMSKRKKKGFDMVGVVRDARLPRFPGLSERHAVGCLAAIPLDKSPTAIQKTMALCQILFWGKPIVEAVCLLQIAHHRSSRSHVQRKRQN